MLDILAGVCNRAIFNLAGLVQSGVDASLSLRRSWVQIPYGPFDGSVAQLVEQRIEAPCVGGSIPSRAIRKQEVAGIV